MRNGKFNEGREYLGAACVLTSASRRSPASKFPSFAPLRREEDDDDDLEDREWQAIITECMLLGKELKLERELEMLDLEESTSRKRSVDEIHNLLERFVCAISLSRESKNGAVLAHEHVLDEVLRAFEQLMTFGSDQLDPDNIAKIVNHAHTIAAQEGLKMMHPLMNRVKGVCLYGVCVKEGESVCVCLPDFLLTLSSMYMQTNEGDCSFHRKVALSFAMQVKSQMYHIYVGTYTCTIMLTFPYCTSQSLTCANVSQVAFVVMKTSLIPAPCLH